MKKKHLPLFLLLCLTLGGCASSPVQSASSSVSTESAFSTAESASSSLSSETSESSSESTAETISISEENSLTSWSESISESSSQSSTAADGTYHFYCINDFHGCIVEQYSDKGYEPGIAKLFGYLKEQKNKDPEHTIILSAGDMYQGSVESNSNFGSLVTEAMNDAGFDAMAIGNHEFDYGQQYIPQFAELADFPILGGNVMKYDNGPTDELWNPDVLAPSTILERGGNKIGIVGMIGAGQTSSITSEFVKDITFPEPSKLALAEAEKLRKEGCSLVIYVLHDTYRNCVDYAADKAYFDGVFTGHTHSLEKKFVNGVPFLQSYSNGTALSHFVITLKDGASTCTTYENISASKYWDEDESIAAIRDSYILDPDFVAHTSAYCGHINGTLQKKTGVPALGAEAIYHAYQEDVECAMTNEGRSTLSGDVYYRDIYKAMPFTNAIVIAKVRGADIIHEMEYNPCYAPGIDTFDPEGWYIIAIIDYLLFHQNTSKKYDYFTSLNEGEGGEVISRSQHYPFDIVSEYIRVNLEGYVNAADYN